jgi:hypothetical protein
MRQRRNIWHRSPRPSRADEKARRKQLEETFGKEVAKKAKLGVVQFEDTRTEERKQLADKLRKEIEADEMEREH